MNKKVIVSGATKGIGRAIVLAMASDGCDVAFCARTAEDVQKFEELLSDKYPDQHFLGVVTDVSIKSQIEAFGERVLNAFDHIDILVNNAGVFLPGALLGEDDGMLELQLNTNLISAYALTRVVAPHMVEQKSGHIINICSVAGIQAYPNGGSYCISKFALRGFSLILREELKESGVKVTNVVPGATWSDSWKGTDLPDSRLMSPEDVAKAVLDLTNMSASSVVEEIIIRPQLGDL